MSLRNRTRTLNLTLTFTFVLLLPALGLAACSSSDDGAADATTTSASSPASTAATTAAPTTTAAARSTTTAAGASIGVADFTFKPATVPPGATVRLANGDSTTHTVESRDGLWTFDTSSETFTAPAAPGSYAIFCGIHSSMTGTLTVA